MAVYKKRKSFQISQKFVKVGLKFSQIKSKTSKNCQRLKFFTQSDRILQNFGHTVWKGKIVCTHATFCGSFEAEKEDLSLVV